MNKLVVALCVVIIVKDSGRLHAKDEAVPRDNSVTVLAATSFVANLLKTAGICKDENATTREKTDAMSDLIEKLGQLGVLMTRSVKVQTEFLKNLADFFSTEEGQEYLHMLKIHIAQLEEPMAT